MGKARFYHQNPADNSRGYGYLNHTIKRIFMEEMIMETTIYLEKAIAPNKSDRDLNLMTYQTLMGISMVLSELKNKVNGLEAQIGANSPKNNELPLSQKYSLNVEEAAVYFGIGERRLRQMAYEHQGENFILEIGSHVRFKRALFEEFLNKTQAV